MSAPQSLNLEEIMRLLPHRYPFLLVDRVVELEMGKRIVALKNITINEPFFQGHFPGRSIMPGVLIIEALAQTGGILALLSTPECQGQPMYLLGLDKVRFRRPVVPGDQLMLEVTSVRGGKKFWKLQGKAMVNEHVVTEAELVAAVGAQSD